MSPDLRDPEVREALDRVVRHLAPDPEARLGTVLRRGGLQRSLRLGVVGVVAALFVAGVGWGAIEIRRRQAVTPLDSARWETYQDSQLGWTMAYPPGWHLQTFHDEFLATFRGALVSNVDFEFRHPDLGEGAHTSAWDMRGLPPDAVVVEFHALSRFGLPTEPPDVKFPLSLDDARRVRDQPTHGAPQPRLFLSLGETGYAVFAWFGAEASERDREIARSIVATITFDRAPSPSPAVLEPLVLEASLTEPLARWTEVAFIPAGDAQDQIGIQRCSDCEITGVPGSFVVDDDGTIWIQDTYKDRIAHFGADGSFLGSISVPDGEAMQGLAVGGGDVYAVLNSRRGFLAHIQGGEFVERITVSDAGDPLVVAELIGGQSELLGLIVDAPSLGAYWAYATIDVPSGQITSAPGVLAAGGSYMDLGLGDEPRLREIRWSDGKTLTAIQEVRFQLVEEGKDVRTTAGEIFVETATSSGVAMVVTLGDAQGLPVGVWYLEIPEDGSTPIFERIPDDGENLRPFRRLVLGPDGAVYRMLVLDDGVHILRR